MWIAASEFLVWLVFGLVLGFALHWWKSNADPYPDIMDKDDPALNLAVGEYKLENYIADNQYDDAGFWEYYSLRNLFFYLSIGLGSVIGPVYATSEGHAAARGALCQVASVVKVTPIFCKLPTPPATRAIRT
jgi:hypothetical protein